MFNAGTEDKQKVMSFLVLFASFEVWPEVRQEPTKYRTTLLFVARSIAFLSLVRAFCVDVCVCVTSRKLMDLQYTVVHICVCACVFLCVSGRLEWPFLLFFF